MHSYVDQKFYSYKKWVLHGLPNNHLRDSAGIPDFHPQIHLNNDAGKLSRLMVATCKYKEIYDMQASRRKATWFNMQKLMVNNYALRIVVLRSRHLLKVLTLIA
jgi:Fe-S cluster biosynthesis and repair protein YggX